MDTPKQVAQTLRKKFKGLGYTSKQISVTSDYNSINVRVKDQSIDAEVIEKIGHQFERIRRCEATGEILSGANFFVFTAYDFQAEREMTETDAFKILLLEITEALDPLDCGYGYEFGRYTVSKERPWSFHVWDNKQGTWQLNNVSIGCATTYIYRARLQGKD